MTQQDRVLAYLQRNGTITQAEALRDLGCARLGARIYELKQAGHRITTSMIPVMNRYGEWSHVARYRLHAED